MTLVSIRQLTLASVGQYLSHSICIKSSINLFSMPCLIFLMSFIFMESNRCLCRFSKRATSRSVCFEILMIECLHRIISACYLRNLSLRWSVKVLFSIWVCKSQNSSLITRRFALNSLWYVLRSFSYSQLMSRVWRTRKLNWGIWVSAIGFKRAVLLAEWPNLFVRHDWTRQVIKRYIMDRFFSI